MKAQMLTVEEMVAPPVPKRGEVAITLLDEHDTRLQMADQSEAIYRHEPIILFKAYRLPERQTSFVKESLILLGLTMIFTSAFWLFLCYLRTH